MSPAMPTSLDPVREAERLAAVSKYDILDTPPDGAFDDITALAAQLFETPISIISVVDHDRIWFKSRHGLDVSQIDREPGLCASAILQDQPWLVSNARADIRTLANPLVAGSFGLQFYLGVPLRTQDGHNLGTLCVIDRQPRTVTAAQIQQLRLLSGLVMNQLELRLSALRAVAELEDAITTLRVMSKEIDHRVMNSLQIVGSLLSLQSREVRDGFASDQLKLAATRVMTVAQVHRHFYTDQDVETTRFLDFLRRLCADLARILHFESIEVDGEEAPLLTSRVVPLALIVTELVTNSIKYGATRVRIQFAPLHSNTHVLSISDDGAGLPDGYEEQKSGFGMKFVRTLAQQIRANVQTEQGIEGRGTTFKLSF
jgi:two-component sensor histidine kinase